MNSQAFQQVGTGAATMTLQGVINKTLILLGVLVASAGLAWGNLATLQEHLMALSIGAFIGGMVLAFITYSKPEIASFTAPLYCILKGILLGVVSAFAEAMFPGIVINAIILTFGILFFMLMAYKNGYIRATPKLQKILMFGLGAYFFLIIANLIMGLFGSGIPSIFGSGPIGIGFSVLIVAMAGFFLILDFDQIEQSIRAGAPKQLEWLSAFGLMVTLIWLYLEVLKLLMKLQSSDD